MERDFGFFNLRDFVIIDGERYRILDVVENKSNPEDSTVFCIESENPRIRIRRFSLSEFKELAEQGKIEIVPSGETTVPNENMDEEDLQDLENRKQIINEALGLIYPNYDAFEHRRGKEVIEYICDKLVVSDSSARFLLNRYLKSGMNPLSLMDMRQGWNAKEKSATVVNGRMNKDGTHSKVTLNEETLNNFEMAFRYFKENCGAGINLSDAYNYLLDVYYTDENTLERLPDDECPSYRRFRSYVEKALKGVSVREFTKAEREKFNALSDEEKKERALPVIQSAATEDVEDTEEDIPAAEEKTEEKKPAEEVKEEPVEESKEEPVEENSVEENSVEEKQTDTVENESKLEEKPEEVAAEPVKEEIAEEAAPAEEVLNLKQDEEPVSFEFQNESENKESSESDITVYAAENKADSEFTNVSELEKDAETDSASKDTEKTEESVEKSEKEVIPENAEENKTAETVEPVPEADQFRDADYIDLDSELVDEEKKNDSVDGAEETAETDGSDEKSILEQEAEKRKEKKAEREKEIKKNRNLFIALGVLAVAFVALVFLLLKKPAIVQQETTLAAETTEETSESTTALESVPDTEIELTSTVEIETESEIQNTSAEKESEVTFASSEVIEVDTSKSESVPTEQESVTEIIAVPSSQSAAETEPVTTVVPGTLPAETTAPETSPVESTASVETKVEKTKESETVVETLPQATTPAVTKPAETKPAETKPAETKPAETTASETIPKETSPPAETMQAKAGDYVTITGNNVNIRLKDSRGVILDRVPRGTILQISGDSGNPNWIQVDFQGKEAVVYKDYLTKNASDAHAQYYKVTGSYVNVRDARDRSIVYTALPYGAMIEEAGAYDDQDWIRFKWNGIDVVISRKYTEAVVDKNAPVKLSGSINAYDPTVEPKGTGEYYRIIANNVNVRDAAFREVAIRSYPKGTIIEKTGDSGDPAWILCRIDHKNVVISANLVEKVKSSELDGLYRVKNDDTLLYKNNDKEDVLTVLPAGIIISGEKQAENSLWVKSEWKGQTVYVSSSDVEAVQK